MIQTKQLHPNPKFNPALPEDWLTNRPLVWRFENAERNLRAGDVVEFLCNGRGRGGHVRVFAKVTKVNLKTFRALELPRSYSPGTNWTVNIEHALQAGNGGITIDLSYKD